MNPSLITADFIAKLEKLYADRLGVSKSEIIPKKIIGLSSPYLLNEVNRDENANTTALDYFYYPFGYVYYWLFGRRV